MDWRTLDEAALASLLFDVIDGHRDSRAIRRIRFRLRDMGENNEDEVAQFRLLQRACREDPELAADFEGAGLPAIESLRVVPATAEAGALIQAFNRMVETRWEES